jgi:hypothetical protein
VAIVIKYILHNIKTIALKSVETPVYVQNKIKAVVARPILMS